MIRTSTQLWEIGLFARTEEGLDRPDLMILPSLPAINPCITTMMVGEKCADMIKRNTRAPVTETTTPATG
ncbi:MAG TPA: hypothetical protein VNR66_11380 [Solirubrobacteraceae bacterium]|nr:hypothetical protein [Solirubrobacteraceae bacterium]